MARIKRFGFDFAVSNGFVRDHPEQAEKYIAIAKSRIAKRQFATGPRGGAYRLLDGPIIWMSSEASYNDFVMNRTRYFAKRFGRYVPPGRVRIEPSLTFDTVTIPVRDGGVTLPDGGRVKTDSRFVSVPVPT